MKDRRAQLESVSTDELVDFAIRLASLGGAATLKYFNERNAAEVKTDGSPVTLADRDAERSMRHEIDRRFPSHSILGEEFGETVGVPEYRWLLDPIDGTVSYVHGVPLYGTTVALLSNGDPFLGVVHFPALGETVWGCRDHGSWRNGSRIRVSPTDSLSQATLVITDRALFAKAGCSAFYDQLRERVAVNRGWGDCYGRMLVATGRADIALDPYRLKEWDSGPVLPIIEEAGGMFTDFAGNRRISSGNGVISNGRLHHELMSLISSSDTKLEIGEPGSTCADKSFGNFKSR